MNRSALLACVLTLAACGSEAVVTEATPSPDVTSPNDVPVEAAVSTLPPPTTATAVLALEVATVQSTPDRGTQIQLVEPPPPPPETAEQLCNRLQYLESVAAPAMQCWVAVVRERGHDDAYIEAWDQFVGCDHVLTTGCPVEGTHQSIMFGESQYCPNRIGGDDVDTHCNTIKRGTGEDAGFGQLTSSLWGRNAILCLHHGYCGQWSIIQSPYHSMRSMQITIEELGSRPWCWNDYAKRYHNCYALAPDL